MSERRAVAWASGALLALFTAASAGQLRAFWWDTTELHRSLLDFQVHRRLLMGSGMARMLLVFPFVALAISFVGEERRARTSRALLALAGGLTAVAGVVQMAMGVASEEYVRAGAADHAIETLADAMYWVQDNLVTLSLICLGAAAVARTPLASPRVRVWSSRLGLVGAVAVLAAFMFNPSTSRNSPLYYPAFAVAAAGILVWIGDLAREAIANQ